MSIVIRSQEQLDCDHDWKVISSSYPQIGCWRQEECFKCHHLQMKDYIFHPDACDHLQEMCVYETTALAKFPFYVTHCMYCNRRKTISSRVSPSMGVML